MPRPQSTLAAIAALALATGASAQELSPMDAVDEYTADLAEAEGLLALGECSRFLELMDDLEYDLEDDRRVSDADARGLFQRTADLRARARAEGCPRYDFRPWVALTYGTGEADLPQVGIGFRRPTGGMETYAGVSEGRLDIQSFGLVWQPTQVREWMLSGSATFTWGDGRNWGMVPAGPEYDSGMVYGGLSPDGNSGINTGPRGLEWEFQTEFDSANFKVKFSRPRQPLFLYIDYLHAERRYDGWARTEVVFAPSTYLISQERTQSVTDDMIGVGVGVQFDSELGLSGWRGGGWASGGLFYRWSELESYERNICELCSAPDDDFELRFDERDEGVSASFAIGGYVEYQLTPRFSIGAGVDGAYLSSVGAGINPSSGDEVFFEGLTTRLGEAEAWSYTGRIGTRFRF